DGGRDEESTVVRPASQLLATSEELVPLLLPDVDVLQDFLLLVGGGDGAHVRLLIDRIADPKLLRPLDEFVDHFIVDFLVHDETGVPGAPLPCGPERAEHHAVMSRSTFASSIAMIGFLPPS